MQFRNLLLATTLLLTGALAEVKLTAVTYAGITVGKAFNISYTDALGPVTLTLQNGPSTNLKDVQTITSGLPSGTGSFIWTPSASLPFDTYAIKVSDGTTTNFSTLFQLVGATASPTDSSSIVSSTSASTSGSTSASSSATTSASTTGSTTASSTSGSSTSANSTMSQTSSSTSSQTSSAAPETTTTAPGGNGAGGLASPLAMVLMGVVGAVFFN